MNFAVAGVAGVAVLGTVAMLTLSGWERPPVESIQRGYRGLGMVELENPRTLAKKVAAIDIPAPIDPVEPGAPPSKEIYENVQVLGDLGSDEFIRLMTAMTEWVSPDQSCSYCHTEDGNFASDALYTKIVARRMLQMTQHINANWKEHVGQTGVTCYTCHRGRNVPEYIWSTVPPHKGEGFAGNKQGQNMAAASVGLSSLPFDPFTAFLEADNNIRVISTSALPQGDAIGTKRTEWTYGLMMHMSNSLGVNCTYCHNSRSFMSWDQGSPVRANAWYGIRMVRDLNNDYLEPLGPQYPHTRLGPLGDAPKANCATCHQGAYKPLYGANMLKDYPELAAPIPVAAEQSEQPGGQSQDK